MHYAGGERVTWHHKVSAGVDRLGQETFTEKSTDIDNVAVWAESVAEPTGGGQYRLLERGSLGFPEGFVPDAADEFTVRGQRYRVTGASDALSVWRNPFTGLVLGSDVLIERVTG